VVYLNTHSHVAIRFTAHTREVRLLDGEALFRVHHDTSRPFRVSTDDAVVQASAHSSTCIDARTEPSFR